MSEEKAAAGRVTATGLVNVDRLLVAVSNIDDATAAYTRMFGRAPSWHRINRTGGTEHVCFYLENMGLELVARCGPGIWGEHVVTHIEKKGEGIIALIFASDDLVSTVEKLRAHDLPVIVMPENQGIDEAGRHRMWRTGIVDTQATRDFGIMLAQTYRHRNDRNEAPLRDGVSADAAVSGLDHVVVMTSDADACKELFGDRLGIRLALDQSKPEWGMRQLFFRLAGITIEVCEPLDKSKVPEVDSLWGAVWTTSDIRAARTRMLAEGAEVSDVRRGRAKGTEVVTIRPPTGGVPTLLIGKSDT